MINDFTLIIMDNETHKPYVIDDIPCVYQASSIMISAYEDTDDSEKPKTFSVLSAKRPISQEIVVGLLESMQSVTTNLTLQSLILEAKLNMEENDGTC